LQNIFGLLCTWGIVVAHLYCSFRMQHQMAPPQPPISGPHFVVNFLPVWGRIVSPIIHRFGRCFRQLLADWMFFTKRFILGTKLLQGTNRKPYPIYGMEPLSMTLSDLWHRFQGHNISRHWISQKRQEIDP